jgi:outer membrane lipoprotein carrier protein
MKFYLTLWAFLVVSVSHADEETIETKKPHEILAEIRKDLSSLQAEFLQYELGQGGEKLEINSGLVWMKSPSMFRWEYQQPIEQLIVADGEQVWVYDEDLEQVTVKAQNNNLNPIYVIINDELSQQHYDIAFEKNEQGFDWISLTPKIPSDDVKYVWLATENSLVKQIKVFNHFDQIMVFEFSGIKKNPKLAANLFEFVPPEGVDVIKALGEEAAK